jgi:hypothetical protein
VSRRFGSTDDAQLAPGDSGVQRAAETVLLAALAVELGLTFGPGKRVMPDGTRVELDAISEEPPVLVEAWSHQGSPKSAQRAQGHDRRAEARVGRGGTLPRRREKILALADEEAAAHFRGASWMSAALVHLGIEVKIVVLPDDVRQAIRRAQERQSR